MPVKFKGGTYYFQDRKQHLVDFQAAILKLRDRRLLILTQNVRVTEIKKGISCLWLHHSLALR